MWHRSGGASVEMGKQCREDLEIIAARLKKRLDVKIAVHRPLVNYLDEHSHEFDGSEQKTLFAIVGGLSMEIPKLEAEYQALLAKIEAGEK